ncbi:MAG: hypothetical protein M3162_09515 [Thermoproteota archaeon]|nr:hypothetical protein [Thermoproteota archaeon]
MVRRRLGSCNSLRLESANTISDSGSEPKQSQPQSSSVFQQKHPSGQPPILQVPWEQL